MGNFCTTQLAAIALLVCWYSCTQFRKHQRQEVDSSYFIIKRGFLCPSKFDTLLSNVITLSNIGRFSIFFSILIGTKFVTSLLLKFPTDPKHVSKLPCETKMFKMCCCLIIKTRRQNFKDTTWIFCAEIQEDDNFFDKCSELVTRSGQILRSKVNL